MQKTYRLNDLTKEEYDELKSCEDIDFALIENHPIANSQVTDDYGNQIEESSREVSFEGRWNRARAILLKSK